MNADQKRRLLRTLVEQRRLHRPLLPIKGEARRFAEELLEFLFPHFSRSVRPPAGDPRAQLARLERELKHVLGVLAPGAGFSPGDVAQRFFAGIPGIYEKLWRDASAITTGDPASENIEEVVLAYPGFLAIAVYRVAHEFWLMHVPVFPRLLTEYAHQLTGIDIHPGARIGTPLFIDHGTGIVIGETTTIGDHVKLYQGVTLGALSVDKSLANTKRHPTIEDNVIVYAQAVILGGETVIGHDSVIGGNSWITRSVPPYSYVYHEIKINVRTPDETNGGVEFVI
ncbi:MAG TPA: serine O-acetyltransferase EpsC [Bacteroidota bacterium]|nr:serine O-acetyltransferase EpsC [Bacteroidota bacterium]